MRDAEPELRCLRRQYGGDDGDAGREPPIVEEAEILPSGVVELVELQRQGWSDAEP